VLTHVENEAALVAQAQAGDEEAFAGVIAEEDNAMMAATSKKEPSGGEESRLASFERLLLPHLDAAYNLARWITGSDQDAEDMVQEAYLRALKSFDGFRGGDGRAWLLTIVRNTCYTWLQQNRSNDLSTLSTRKYTTLRRRRRVRKHCYCEALTVRWSRRLCRSWR
jgi:DNA-directed RNA polymerase specialized sigma24 family protein